MSLIQVLTTSLSGLSTTQTDLGVVAGNIANAQTPGYIARSPVEVQTVDGGVHVASINRLLDQFVQQQLRTETAGGAFADLRAGFYQQLQQVYGQPGSDSSLDAVFNKFTTAVQGLATSPSSTSAQGATLNAAQALAQQLNSATSSIQALRSRADQGIANDVQQVNDALKQIATVNEKLAGNNAGDSAAAALADQRDEAIDQLSKLLDIHVVPGNGNQISVFTASGTSLVTANRPAQLEFTASGNISATQQWNADPSKSGLSSVTVRFPDGTSADLTANRLIHSGEIAAYVDLRDNVLVQAQSQLDELAAQISRAVSDTTTSGTAATAGTQTGFDVDIGGLQPGNSVNINYTDASNVAHKLTIVSVDDPTALPLSNSVTPDPADTVVGVNFTGGPASVVAQLTAALGATGLQFSNPAGTTLRVLNNAANTIAVNNVSTTTTATSLTGGPALPLFLDGGGPFTGAITGAGVESAGLAGRIAVNGALLANPSSLVTFQPTTPIGDSTRPNFIYNQLATATRLFAPSTGIGGTTAPFQGTLSAYLGAVVGAQGQAATTAQDLQSGQDIVVNALKARFNDTAGVNIDTELSRLLTLQSAYGANARVLTTVKQLFDTLLQV